MSRLPAEPLGYAGRSLCVFSGRFSLGIAERRDGDRIAEYHQKVKYFKLLPR